MDLFSFSPLEIQKFLLIFVRVGAILIFAPIFGGENIPLQIKVALILLVSIVVYPLVRFEDFVLLKSVFSLALAIGQEILLGLTISFIVNLLFAGIQLAGQWVGFQVGFAIVNVLDPATGTEISIIAQFKNLLALLIFLTFNGHHLLLGALAKSFSVLPPMGVSFSGSVVGYISHQASHMFFIAVQIGAPIMAALFLIEIALGMIARTVPQINVFFVGFPIRIAVGIFFLGVTIPYFILLFKENFARIGEDILNLLKFMAT